MSRGVTLSVVTHIALMTVAAMTLLAVQSSAPKDKLHVTETQHLTVTPSVSATGTRVSLIVDIVPKPKMHVYSPEQKDYVPISLTLAATDGVKAGAPVFPKAEKYVFEALKETQLVYSKPFRIVQDVTLARAPADRRVTVKGTLRYQACDDRVCYMPQSVGVVWEIKVP